MFGRGTLEFGGGLTGFAEVGFTSSETFTQNPPFSVPSSQIGPGVARNVQIVLPVGHNSNPFNVPIELRYRFSDVGPRKIVNTADATRLVAGLSGSWGDWQWESAAGYTKSELEQQDKNNIRISGLLAAVADGSYNFVNNAANTEAVYDRVRTNYSRFGDSTMSFIDAKATRELMQLAHGPLAVAAGVEFRREKIDDRSDEVLVSGDVLGRGSTQTKGERDITSGYVEFNIPAMRNVELQIAGRADNYSDYGSSTTPKVAARWTPTPQWLLRASYAKGFRAPSIAESGESSAFFFQTLQDTTRCAINSLYCGPVSVPGSFSSNPDLKPEKSDSWTAGFVWEPVRDASLGIEYYFIKQKDLVSSRDFQFILDNESRYAQYVTRGPQTADDIVRGAPGPIVLVAVPYENLQRVETSGVDVDARWRWNAGNAGLLSLGFNGSYIISFKQPDAPEEPLEELAGTYDLPRFRAQGSLGWDRGPWSGTVVVNYIHGFSQSTSASASADQRIKAWTTVDLQASYSGLRNTKLVVGMKNAADKEPPLAIVEALLYTFETHNVRGRFVYASVNYRFR